MNKKTIKETLFEMQDNAYKDFNKKLIPNIDENLIQGYFLLFVQQLLNNPVGAGNDRIECFKVLAQRAFVICISQCGERAVDRKSVV